MDQDSPELLAMQAALQAPAGTITVVEAQGLRCVVESGPEPGVKARWYPEDGSAGAWTCQHFAASEARPPSYPDEIPFVAGIEAIVVVSRSPEVVSVSWVMQGEERSVLDALFAALWKDGWAGEGTRFGPGEASAEFYPFVKRERKCMVVATHAARHGGSETMVTLSDYPAWLP